MLSTAARIDIVDDRHGLQVAGLEKCRQDIIHSIRNVMDDLHLLQAQQDILTLNNHKRGDPRNIVQLLQRDVMGCLKAAQERAAYRETYASDMVICRQLMNIVAKVSDTSATIARCVEALDRIEVIVSCSLWQEIAMLMRDLPAPNTEIGTGAVCRTLRREARVLHSRLQETLKQSLEACVLCENGRLRVMKRISASSSSSSSSPAGELRTMPLDLPSVWSSMISVGCAEENVMGLVANLWERVLMPLWKASHAAVVTNANDDFTEIQLDAVHSLQQQQPQLQNQHQQPSPAAVMGNINAGHDQGRGDGDVITKSTPFPGTTATTSFSQLLEAIIQILTFAKDEVFCGIKEIMQIAEEKLYSGSNVADSGCHLSRALVQTLSMTLPKTELDLTAFQEAVYQCSELFEERMRDLGFPMRPFPSDRVMSAFPSNNSSAHHRTGSGSGADSGNGPTVSFQIASGTVLTDAIAELGRSFIEVRRRELLAKGRDLLLTDYHDTVKAAGEDESTASSSASLGQPGRGVRSTPPLQGASSSSSPSSLLSQRLGFESCQVSVVSRRLVQLIHEILEQATASLSSSSTTAAARMLEARGGASSLTAVLYQTARDCLDLFLAVVPVRHADVIDTVPRMGAVFHNDCCFLAHHCTLLTFLFQEGLERADGALRGNVGLVDVVPRLRELGERCLSVHVDEQKSTLQELVSRLNLNPESDSEPAPSSAASSSTSRNSVRGRVVGAVGAVSGAFLKKIGGMALSSAGADLAEHLADRMTKGPNRNNQGRSVNAQGEVENNEEAAALVVKHLERLRGQWQGTLQQSVYVKVLGYLLEAVLLVVMRPVLETDCVTECAASEISRVYRALQKSREVITVSVSSLSSSPASSSSSASSSLLASLVSAVPSSLGSGLSDEQSNGAMDAAVNEAVPSWSKFCALTDLLEYSLSEVAEWLPRRKFAAFTGSEMSALIQALFEDSPRRQTILKSIAEMIG